MSTKVFFYTLRPFDEQAIVKDLAQQWGVEYGYTEAYPTLENAQLAAGYDAVSLTPCDMSAPMVQRFHDLGVKAICCRSIGYDHVDLEKVEYELHWAAPFRYLRINGCLLLPEAFRSLPRLSSAPSAKAFTLRPF